MTSQFHYSLPTTHFTASQIRWAQGHDWFVGVAPTGKIVCTDEYTKDGVAYRDVASFTDFRAMREWAGY